jgi:hypothetical protein
LLEAQVKSIAELESLVFRASASVDRMLRGFLGKLLMSGNSDEKNPVVADVSELRI